MKKYFFLILIIAFLFLTKTDNVSAQVSCGWDCNGTTAACKPGGDYNWTGYCDNGSQGNCHEYCVGSIDTDVNCGGVIQHVTCNTFTKQQEGCCRTSPPSNPTNTPTPTPTNTPTPTRTPTPTNTPTPTGCPDLCVSSTTVQTTIDNYCNNEAVLGKIAPCSLPNIWQSPMTCQASEPKDPLTNQCTWAPYGPNCTTQSCQCTCISPATSCTQDKFITLPSPPTPTTTNQAGIVKFKVKLQGVEYDNIAKEEDKRQKVKISFQIIKKMADGTYQSLPPTTFSNVEIKAVKPASGKIAVWEGQVDPAGVALGNNYVIFIKGSKHLQRKFCIGSPTENAEGGFPYRCLGQGQITLTSGENNLDFSGVLLQGGDLPVQDGIVNAYDVSRILDILRKGESRKAEDLAVSDIDLNGVVNAKDRSYLIETLEEKYGDEE